MSLGRRNLYVVKRPDQPQSIRLCVVRDLCGAPDHRKTEQGFAREYPRHHLFYRPRPQHHGAKQPSAPRSRFQQPYGLACHQLIRPNPPHKRRVHTLRGTDRFLPSIGAWLLLRRPSFYQILSFQSPKVQGTLLGNF